ADDSTALIETEAEPRSYKPVFWGAEFFRPGATQLRLAPVGVITTDSIAGIGHDQLEFGQTGNPYAHKPGRIIQPHHPALEQLLAISEDLKNHGAVGVASHLPIHAHPGGEVRVPAFNVINDFAVGVSAQAEGELALADCQRPSLHTAIHLQLAIILPCGYGHKRRQWNIVRG